MTDPLDPDGWKTGPIRTASEVAEIMRDRGDLMITAGTVWTIEQRALSKLREQLAGFEEEIP